MECCGASQVWHDAGDLKCGALWGFSRDLKCGIMPRISSVECNGGSQV